MWTHFSEIIKSKVYIISRRLKVHSDAIHHRLRLTTPSAIRHTTQFVQTFTASLLPHIKLVSQLTYKLVTSSVFAFSQFMCQEQLIVSQEKKNKEKTFSFTLLLVSHAIWLCMLLLLWMSRCMLIYVNDCK